MATCPCLCRYSIDGARALLTEAGLRVVSLAKMGDTAIASGFLLGFGAGDVAPQRLASKLLVDVTRLPARQVATAQEALYIGVAAVARKPARGGKVSTRE